MHGMIAPFLVLPVPFYSKSGLFKALQHWFSWDARDETESLDEALATLQHALFGVCLAGGSPGASDLWWDTTSTAEKECSRTTTAACRAR